MMSLVAGALMVSRRPNAISREEVSMATLEAGTTPTAATNRHRHIVQTCVPKRILTRENTGHTVFWKILECRLMKKSFIDRKLHCICSLLVETLMVF